MLFLFYIVYGVCRIAILMIVLQAIMSWFVQSMSGPVLTFYDFLCTFTEPLIRPFRVLTQRFAYSVGIDFSPILAIFAIQIIERLLIHLIAMLVLA